MLQSRDAAPSVHTIRALLATLAAVEVVFWVSHPAATLGTPLRLAIALGFAVSAGLAWRRQTGRQATVAAGLGTGLVALAAFPHGPAHQLTLVAALGLAALFDFEDADEHAAARSALRGLAVVTVVWMALQKVLHGLWFHAEHVTFLAAVGALDLPDWGDATARVVALRASPAGVEGAGPFRVESGAVWALAASAWLLPLAGGAGLAVGSVLPATLAPRLADGLRCAAFGAAAVGVLATQFTLHDGLPGLLALTLLAAWTGEAAQRGVAVLVVCVAVAACLSALGVLPVGWIDASR